MIGRIDDFELKLRHELDLDARLVLSGVPEIVISDYAFIKINKAPGDYRQRSIKFYYERVHHYERLNKGGIDDE